MARPDCVEVKVTYKLDMSQRRRHGCVEVACLPIATWLF
jgi:hypothetical protein